jgi:hypothetical protein
MPSLTNPLLKSPKKKAPIPESLVALNGRPVAPVLSDEDDYCWVFHPSYGFYFIEGQTNNHYRFFKGDGVGTSHTEVIPNKLYDDCNRGYMFVDRKKKTVQIQTAKLVKDYLDFVPKEVLSGFKKAFPGYDVYLRGCHMASLRQKKALDAMLETMDQEKHPDQSYTTQNGKMMGKGTEVEQGALNDGIPGSLLASKKCAACESGDCITHPGSINALTNSVVTPKAPIEADIQDANFFKESEDEFEVTRTASGQIVVADTKSYGAGTPNGGTPSTPQPTSANPTPPPPATPNQVPPVQTVNKTPQQLHDEAEGSPTESGNLTQQQLQQVLQSLKSSSEIESFAVEKFAEQIRNAAIPIKPSPTSLPPRDDMRRHIDETAQNEVMEGVKPTAPSTTTPQPQVQAQPPAQPQAPAAPTAEQELLKQTLASEKTAAWEEEDDEDDGPDGAYGTMYGKPLGGDDQIKERLEYLRGELQAERISQGELMELQSLAEHIEPGDVELLEAAGVPEFPEEDNTMYCPGCQEPGVDVNGWTQFRHTPVCKFKGQVWDDSKAQWKQDMAPLKPVQPKRFRPTNKDKDLLKSMGIKAKKAMQTEEGVNQVCPACHGQDVKNLENTSQEDGSLVECLTCGCFFAL